MGIDSASAPAGPADGDADGDADLEPDDFDETAAWIEARVEAERAWLTQPSTAQKLGRAILRLRMYWGWSQKELEGRSGVDQTTISRFERGVQQGLTLQRLIAILARKPNVEPTPLELMLWGRDPWQRAIERADRKLNRRRSA